MVDAIDSLQDIMQMLSPEEQEELKENLTIQQFKKNDVEDKDVIIDCTNLEYVSSAGLRIFLGILQKVEEKGRHVYLTGINDKVRGILTITGFINIFEFK